MELILTGNMDYFYHQLESEFKKLSWDEVYSFVEFLLLELPNSEKVYLVKELNQIFFEEGVPYKIIDDKVTRLISDVDFKQIEDASKIPLSGDHIKKAIELFSKRPSPDYSNSIKESISAVEAVAREVTGESSATLSVAVKKMKLHPLLQTGIEKIYAWTNDEGGLRHAFKTESNNPGEPEARYMLILCSALITFLKKN